MWDRARRARSAAVLDIAVSLASVYPAALRAGAAYWAELFASASDYHVDLLEAMIRAWRDPLDSCDAVADVTERFKSYLERTGDNVERAILEFNQGLVALRRRSRPPAPSAWDELHTALRNLTDAVTMQAATGHSQAGPDLEALRDCVEALRVALGRRDSDARAGTGAPPPAGTGTA